MLNYIQKQDDFFIHAMYVLLVVNCTCDTQMLLMLFLKVQ